MPSRGNPNHTPPRSIRVSDPIWNAAQEVATQRGETVSEAVNRFLARYIKTGIKQETELERELRRLGA